MSSLRRRGGRTEGTNQDGHPRGSAEGGSGRHPQGGPTPHRRGIRRDQIQNRRRTAATASLSGQPQQGNGQASKHKRSRRRRDVRQDHGRKPYRGQRSKFVSWGFGRATVHAQPADHSGRYLVWHSPPVQGTGLLPKDGPTRSLKVGAFVPLRALRSG